MKPFYRLVFTLAVAEFARGLVYLGVLPWLGTAAAVGAMSLNLLGETFAKPLGGWVIDRYGWRMAVRLALPLLAGGLLLTATPKTILVGAVASGLAVGWIHLAVLRAGHGEELSWVQSAWMVGVGAGVLGAPWVAEFGLDLPVLCYLSAGLTGTALLSAWNVASGRAPEGRQQTGSFGQAWRAAVRLMPLVFVQTAVAAGLIAALPILGRMFWGPGQYNLVLVAGALACVPFLLNRRLHNRKGRIAGAIAIAIGLGLLAANFHWLAQAAAMAILGAGLGLFMPAWLHVVKIRAPEAAAGRLWALVGLIEGLSASVGSALSEWLAPRHASGLLASGAFAYAMLALVHTFFGLDRPVDGGPMSHHSSAMHR